MVRTLGDGGGFVGGDLLDRFPGEVRSGHFVSGRGVARGGQGGVVRGIKGESKEGREEGERGRDQISISLCCGEIILDRTIGR